MAVSLSKTHLVRLWLVAHAAKLRVATFNQSKWVHMGHGESGLSHNPSEIGRRRSRPASADGPADSSPRVQLALLDLDVGFKLLGLLFSQAAPEPTAPLAFLLCTSSDLISVTFDISDSLIVSNVCLALYSRSRWTSNHLGLSTSLWWVVLSTEFAIKQECPKLGSPILIFDIRYILLYKSQQSMDPPFGFTILCIDHATNTSHFKQVCSVRTFYTIKLPWVSKCCLHCLHYLYNHYSSLKSWEQKIKSWQHKRLI